MAKREENFVVTKNKISNKKCPYGYSFCYKKKQAKDKRYIQELTCNWIFGSKGPVNLICLEMEIEYRGNPAKSKGPEK